MQNKGLVMFFAVVFGLVSIYQLTFTFAASNVEEKARHYAQAQVPSTKENYGTQRNVIERKYLDSINNESVFLGYTYKEIKDREIKQGLDLKGGINVTLQISVKDILRGLADNSKNAIFEKSLADADQALRDTDKNYLDLFFEAFEKNAGQLSAIDVFGNKNLSDEVRSDMTNAQVRAIIERKVEESVGSAFEVLRKRIDKFGVSNPDIKRLGNSGRISVELPGAKDIARVKNLLQSTAQLEFWETYKAQDVDEYLANLNTVFAAKIKAQNPEPITSVADSLLTEAQKDSITLATQVNPVFELIQLRQGNTSPSIGYFSTADTTKLMSYIRSEEGKKLLPNTMKYVRFAFGIPHQMKDLNKLYRMFMPSELEKAQPAQAQQLRDNLTSLLKKADLVELYALKANRDNIPPLSGGVITDAVQTYDMNGQPCVSMSMDVKGARIWEALTGKAFTEQGNIAIVLDNVVYSAPGVTSGPISGGNSQITGNFTVAEGQDLANVLRAGKLPASADIVQSEIVGPSLGQESIDNGFMSFGIAGLLIFVWMVFYYGRAGIYADIALLFNLLLIFGVLSSIGSVLTLPGIAGIVLTVGMSIDANVLIFERIKEELRKGKAMVQAISEGFSNALSSILDSNITTFLTGLVLFFFGSGAIKGFATTLMIGIVTTLFTAIFITRLLIDFHVEKKGTLSFWTAPTKDFLTSVNFNFIDVRKKAYIVALVYLLVCVGSIFVRGFDEGIDFAGGRSYQVRFKDEVKTADIRQALQNNLGNVDVKTFGSQNQVKLTTKYKVNEESTEVDNEIQHILHRDLKTYTGDISYEEFTSGEGIGIMKADKVGPSIAEDIKSSASWSVIGSLAVIFLYILLRFRRWQFSLGAIAALTHDVIVVLGLFSLLYAIMPFSLEIDQSFIAAVLTVIGYSLNDTVIVYDRIRETINERGWSKENLNYALNSTLSRTLNTSLTTLLTLLAIFIFGGESLRGFMFAMIIGIGIGTFSSLFIATQLLYDTLKGKVKGMEQEQD